MKVVYSGEVDGWVPCQTEQRPVLHGWGPIEISTKAWERLSNPQRRIPCRIGLTETFELLAIANEL